MAKVQNIMKISDKKFLIFYFFFLLISFVRIRILPNVEIEISCCFDEEIFTTTNVTVTDELTNPGGVNGSGNVAYFKYSSDSQFNVMAGSHC